MFVVPCVTLVATPLWFTTATVGVDDVHVQTEVMSCVEPSLKLPVAVKGCSPPMITVCAAGATVMLCRVALLTVRVVVAGVSVP